MSEELRRLVASLSPSKRAMLARLLDTPSEPIAIVGAGCRLPGASSPEDFWRVLVEKRCTTTVAPADHDLDFDGHFEAKPGVPGRLYTRHGGFVDGVDRFDAEFFGITPREAESMDPQQRLLLEVSWEALEDAGIVPDDVRGPQTGVFVGICSDDYITRQIRSGRPEDIDVYSLPGVIPSVACGRISYVLDFQGPNLSVDTACSSSLVAVHYACQSLRTRECRVALAAGVNLILAPENTIYFSTAGLLSSDGRCKAFDVKGDGFVRAEGCAVVVLKRLADAQADGDAVLAVIRGTAVNHNGHGNGLTAPSVTAQAQVIARALADARVSAADVGFIEAHGTGTPMGDAIEVDGIREAYGTGRSAADGRCYIGSVKTNVGHMEGAAGLGGLLKATLALRHELIPANLHFTQANPHIALDGTPFAFPQEAIPWTTSKGKPRFAGVSSFGFGGTNAHAIIAEAPPGPPRAAVVDDGAHLLVLSAKTPESLRRLAAAYASALVRAEDLRDVCFTASARRAHHRHRVAVRGATAAELISGLSAYARGTPSPHVVAGVAGGERPRVAVIGGGGVAPDWLIALGVELDLVVGPDAIEEIERSDEAFDALVLAVEQPAIVERLQRAREDSRVVCAFGRDHTAALAELYVLGCGLRWKALYPGARHARLPTYPFERKRFWIDRPKHRVASESGPAPSRPHLRGERVRDEALMWVASVGPDSAPFLREHVVGGATIAPAALFLEFALAGARSAFGDAARGLDAVALRSAMPFVDGADRTLRLEIERRGGPPRFTVTSEGADGPAIVHVTGTVALGDAESATEDPLAEATVSRSPIERPYDTFAAQSIEYGPAFRRLNDVRRGAGECSAELDAALDPQGYLVHPAVLDAALQAFALAMMEADRERSAGAPYVPVAIRSVRISGDVSGRCRVRARLREPLTGDVTVFGEGGTPVLTLAGVVAHRLDGAGTDAGHDAKSARTEWIRAQVARVLRTDVQTIDPGQPINRLGVDSLLAVELKNRIEAEFGRAVPAVSFLKGLTVAGLVDLLEATPVAARPEPRSEPVDIARLSNGEVQTLLASMLADGEDLDDRESP